MQAGDLRITATLSSVLNDNAVLLLSRDSDASFAHIVTHRLFNVHMLSSLRGPDRDQRVPVIRRRDRDGVKIFILKGHSDIGDTLRSKLILQTRLKRIHGIGQHLLIRIDQVSNLDIRLLQPTSQMTLSATIQSTNPNANSVVGPQHLTGGSRPGKDQRCAGCR